MPPWLDWISQEIVHIKKFWRTALVLTVLVSGAIWVVKDYLEGTQKSNLQSELAVLRARLESGSGVVERMELQLRDREGELARLKSELAAKANRVITLEGDLQAATNEIAALKSQLRVQTGRQSRTPTEVESAWTRLGLSPEEFGALPLHWRQALAELAISPRADLPALARFVSELLPEDIRLIDRVAPAVAHNGLDHFVVRGRTSRLGHPYLQLGFADFRRLREIGLLHHGDSLAGVRVRQGSEPPVSLWGTSVALAVHSLEGESNLQLPVATFTDVGATLVELLRVPSDLRYFAWVADTIRGSTLDVQLWALSRSPDSAEVLVPGMGRIERVYLGSSESSPK